MSNYFYISDEENNTPKEESINKYLKLFSEYINNPPKLDEALCQMFLSVGASEDKIKELIKFNKDTTKDYLEDNWEDIKKIQS